jgi:hypothetical protein
MKINNEIAFEILECLHIGKSLKDIEIKYKTDFNNIRLPFYQAMFQLTESGSLKYEKLCYENYYFWWYEVPKDSGQKFNKTIFTCDVDDFTITIQAREILRFRDMLFYKQRFNYYGYYNYLSEYRRLEDKIERYESLLKYKDYFTDEYIQRVTKYCSEYIEIINYKPIGVLFLE